MEKKGLGEMAFNASDGAINGVPGHFASVTRAILDYLKLADLVHEVMMLESLSPPPTSVFSPSSQAPHPCRPQQARPR